MYDPSFFYPGPIIYTTCDYKLNLRPGSGPLNSSSGSSEVWPKCPHNAERLYNTCEDIMLSSMFGGLTN